MILLRAARLSVRKEYLEKPVKCKQVVAATAEASKCTKIETFLIRGLT